MDRAPTARNNAWVARVVAWHNRHPLARRITPAQVQGLGYVDLPFSAADAKARRQWQAVFSEDFLPPLRTAGIARWALRHGQDQTPKDVGQPVRQVPIDRSRLPPEGLALVLWVGTAAIHDDSGEQTRVLLGPAAPHAVLGRRLWSRPRLATAALSLLLLVSVPALLRLRSAPPDDEDSAPVVAQAASAALPPGMTPAVAAVLAAASAAPKPLPASAPAAPREPAAPASSAEGQDDLVPPVAAAASAAAAPPVIVAVAPATSPTTPPRPPRAPGPFPPRRPLLVEASKILAQQEVAAARAAQASAKGRPVYAVATQQVRTQAESELLGATLQQALVNTEAPRGLRVETLPAGRDWRAVCWPFLNRDDAERVREQLAARGQRIEIIAF